MRKFTCLLVVLFYSSTTYWGIGQEINAPQTFPVYRMPVIDEARSYGLGEYKRPIQVYSKNKKDFTIANYSDFDLTIKVSGLFETVLYSYQEMYLKKNLIDSSTTLNVEYSRQYYRAKEKSLRERIEFNGGAIVDSLHKIIMNRDRSLPPVVTWKDEIGDVHTKIPDPVMHELNNILIDMTINRIREGYPKAEERSKKELERRYTLNELLYQASLGNFKELSFLFEYDDFYKNTSIPLLTPKVLAAKVGK